MVEEHYLDFENSQQTEKDEESFISRLQEAIISLIIDVGSPGKKFLENVADQVMEGSNKGDKSKWVSEIVKQSKKESNFEQVQNEIDLMYEQHLSISTSRRKTQNDEDHFVTELQDDIIALMKDVNLSPGLPYMTSLAQDVLKPLGYGKDDQLSWVEEIFNEFQDFQKIHGAGINAARKLFEKYS